MKRLLLSGLVFLTLGLSAVLRAEVAVPALFSDHAVLQKAAKVPVWGKAAPDEVVTVSVAGATASATAAADGKWRAVLDLSDKGPGPFELTISGSASAKPIVAADVLVGEVWIASGQSNMEFVMKNSQGAEAEIAASANPQFRQFLVRKNTSPEPLDEVQGSWAAAGPESTGLFTAVGYYFGRKLQKELGVPVGLIHTSWGGTLIEAWTSKEALDSVPAMKEGADKNRLAHEGSGNRFKTYVADLAAWETQYGRALPLPGDLAPFVGAAAPLGDWKAAKIPGTPAAAVLPEAGAIWLRRTVTVTAEAAAARAPLEMSPLPGFDTVYWNGQKLGNTLPESGGVLIPRRYAVPAPVKLEAGEGVLAIRVAFPAGGVVLPTQVRWGTLNLDGDWIAKAEKELPPLDAAAKAAYPAPLPRPTQASSTATYLFNAMVAPLIPYAMRGTIWYQGEANAGRAFQYRIALPLMISDWRARWGEGDFPFYLCQLANYQARKPAPSESSWAELREAQTKTLSVANTGMAILIDCGDEGNIHPIDKKTPGERLAAIALANTYGKSIPFSGPVFGGMTVEGDAVRVRFTHAEGGLVAKDLPAEYVPNSVIPDKKAPVVRNVPQSPLEGFSVCGDDHAWKWAEAKIDGEAVVVRSAEVPKPVAVRYAWADDPLCNLYNGAGFPAGPFRSDEFPGLTDKFKF